MPDSPLIALISATFAAVDPATSALAADFPESTPWNLVDDRLLVDATAQGGVSVALAGRMERIIAHAIAEGADGVLLTCSLYGRVAHDFEGAAIPILAPDDAAFDEAIAGAYRHILVVGSLPAAVADAEARFRGAVAAAASPTVVSSIVAAGAIEATNAGDHEALSRSLIAACREGRDGVDAILLAQYSLAPAASSLSAALGIPVISGPQAAAVLLRSRLVDAL